VDFERLMRDGSPDIESFYELHTSHYVAEIIMTDNGYQVSREHKQIGWPDLRCRKDGKEFLMEIKRAYANPEDRPSTTQYWKISELLRQGEDVRLGMVDTTRLKRNRRKVVVGTAFLTIYRFGLYLETIKDEILTTKINDPPRGHALVLQLTPESAEELLNYCNERKIRVDLWRR